jgi:hypothetical protein
MEAALSSMIVVSVHTASSAVKGSPSLKVTSSRRANVQVRPSSEDSQDSARAGAGSLVSASTVTSGS